MAIREIIFRGKRVDNGEWVEGYYVCISETYHYILTGNPVVEPGKIDVEHYKVIPETVGQYTGLTDKNGRRIFEGDIVKCTDETNDYSFTAVVMFGNPNGEDTGAYIEVVGNIHDNKELLKGE